MNKSRILFLFAFVSGICFGQIPTITQVQNGATFNSTISSRAWVTIRGTNLSATTRIWGTGDFLGDLLPFSLDTVGVKINGKPAAVYFVSPAQLNVLAPADDATGFVTVEASGPFGTATSRVLMERFTPGFFAFAPENNRFAAGVFPDGTYLGEPNLFFGLALRTAQPGDRLIFFGTGFGDTDPAVPTDRAFSGAAPLIENVRIQINGLDATVEFAGLVGVGLYQFNIIVPNVPDGEAIVRATIGGVLSPPVYIPVGNVPQADLVVSSITATTSARAGGPLGLTVQSTNRGEGGYIGSVLMHYYFSRDGVITPLDFYSGYGCQVGNLFPGESRTCGGSLIVPENLPPGVWEIGAIIDTENQVPESNENNNTMVASTGPVTILPASAALVPVPTYRSAVPGPPALEAVAVPLPPPTIPPIPSTDAEQFR